MASPASPVLADRLLEGELRGRQLSAISETLATGFKDVDKVLSHKVWSSGKMIAILSEEISLLSEHILAGRLLSIDEEATGNQIMGFIIAPYNSGIVANIHASLIKQKSQLPQMDNQSSATLYLDRVQLLQYFDFAGLTESVAEVSARLFELSSSCGTLNTVLHIEGLGTTIESAQRRNGLVQANALLSSLLRTLSHLSRTHPSLMMMLGLGSKLDMKREDRVQSAFATDTRNEVRMQPGGALGRTLEGAMDVIVLVHDAHGTAKDGTVIAEVVKDRVGETLGEWTAWKVE